MCLGLRRPNNGGEIMKITVLGLGYVGLVTAAGLANSGYEVTGLDIDIKKVQMLQNKEIYIYEPGLLLMLTIDSALFQFKFSGER